MDLPAAGARGAWQEETPETLRLAEAAGFIVDRPADVFKGQDIAAMRLAEWDDHPNAPATSLIAARSRGTARQAGRDLRAATP